MSMKVKVFIERQNKNMQVTLESKATIASLLKKIGVSPVEVVVAKNGDIVTEDTDVNEGDEIKVFSVVSGG